MKTITIRSKCVLFWKEISQQIWWMFHTFSLLSLICSVCVPTCIGVHERLCHVRFAHDKVSTIFPYIELKRISCRFVRHARYDYDKTTCMRWPLVLCKHWDKDWHWPGNWHALWCQTNRSHWQQCTSYSTVWNSAGRFECPGFFEPNHLSRCSNVVTKQK